VGNNHDDDYEQMADIEADEDDVESGVEQTAVDKKKKRRLEKMVVRQAVKEHRESAVSAEAEVAGASWQL
jgi:hypothetical protein